MEVGRGDVEGVGFGVRVNVGLWNGIVEECVDRGRVVVVVFVVVGGKGWGGWGEVCVEVGDGGVFWGDEGVGGEVEVGRELEMMRGVGMVWLGEKKWEKLGKCE